MTKKYILVATISGLVMAYILNNPLSFGICVNSYILSGHTYCQDTFEYSFSHLLFSFFLPILPFSLITYKMRDEVFQSWWSFARWFVPAIIVITFLLNNSTTAGNPLNAAESFNFLIIFILYVIFIIVSTVKIIKAYKK